MLEMGMKIKQTVTLHPSHNYGEVFLSNKKNVQMAHMELLKIKFVKNKLFL